MWNNGGYVVVKKLNNKGVSLIELIVALAIVGMITTAIISFMTLGMNSFNASKSEVTVQSESQTAMNQISDLVLDADKGVKIFGAYSTVYDKVLVIYNEADIDMIFYHAGNKKLYYVKKSRSGPTVFAGTESEIQTLADTPAGAIDDKNLMSQYVTAFTVSEIYDAAGKVIANTVTLNMTFEYKNKSFVIYKKVALRNTPKENP